MDGETIKRWQKIADDYPDDHPQKAKILEQIENYKPSEPDGKIPRRV